MTLEFLGQTLLPRLLAASVQSLVLVALVWALCCALPRLSAAARCWLWWLVALQLVVGLVWSSPMALPLLPAETVAQAVPEVFAAVAATPLSAPVDMAPAIDAPVASGWSWSAALAGIWLFGLSVMLTRTLRGYLQTRSLLRESQECRDTALTQAMALAAEAHGLRAAPRLRLSTSIDSPQLIGPWRPVLLLPSRRLASLQADELDMALTHELVHLQRGDLWWGLLPALAQHLFFFHPLVHLANREYAFAREAACDAAVLAGSPHCARDYGRLLLRLGVAQRPHAGLASASPTFHVLKRRLLMLQNTASLPRTAALAILLLTAVLGVMPYRITAAQAATAAVAPVAPSKPRAPAAAPAAPQPRVAASPHAATAPRAVTVPAGAPAPAPVAAPTAPVAPASSVPAAPSAPRAPAAPPAPMTLHGTFTLSNGPMASAFVLMSEDGSVANASTSDLREARAMRQGDEELLWLRKGNTRYVVRDPATLQRFRAAYAETTRLGEAQGALGERQGRLGEQQGALGERQGELGMRMAELAAEEVRQARSGGSSRSERMAALQAQQRGLGEQMAALGERQAALGREQATLGEKQGAAAIRAEREAAKLIEQSIANGLAQALRN